MSDKLGGLIDEIYALEAKIDQASAVVSTLKQKRDKLEDKLLRNFDKEELNGAQGKRAKARINKTRHPTLKDRKSFIKYVVAKRAWDLFQNRISSTAYFERLEAGENVPGVEVFTKIKVSVTKRK